MYKIAFENDSHHGSQVKLLQCIVQSKQADSVVIARASHLSQSSMPQAQSSLLLDFSIRDVTHNEKKWNGFQHTLQQIFANVIQLNMMPGCQCKINIFILMEGKTAQSAIINSCWAAFLKLGLPMSRSIWAFSNHNSIVVANLFEEHEIVFGKYTDKLTEQNITEMKEFQKIVREGLQVQ